MPATNRRGQDKNLEKRNIRKLASVKAAGYKIVLVREGIEVDY
tara:strand:+ start:2345 stop:2473 length:129 start_codon:yes stop_codon:yes gene_type:complete